MIRVEGLTKDFVTSKKYEGLGGTIKSLFCNEKVVKRAIDNLNFTVETGEIFGYIGLNGAGKSTTIKILSGIMKPTHGICQVNGMIPYREREKYTKNIGIVFGNRSQLWWDLPVSESFTVLQKIYEIPQREFLRRLDFLIETFELGEFYLSPVRNLSLGQRMRADLAASMIHNPSVLFLDEPTVGVDILVKEKIRMMIKRINSETNTTIILTTHDLTDIEKTCNKIVVIDKGKKIFDGDINQLKNIYSLTKTIIFELDKEINNNLNYMINKDGILEVNKEKNKITIKFIKDKLNIKFLIQDIFKLYDVKDFVVVEPCMEDIIKMIYSDRG